MGPVLLVLAAYLAGSIPFGLLVGRWAAGVDVREQGSGNIGATNVARVAGRAPGALVLLLDLLKGLLPALAARHGAPGDEWTAAAAGAAAIAGHLFPVWLRFRGGKGVATSFGVLCALAPLAAAVGAATFAFTFALGRIVSVASLAGALAAAVGAVATLGATPVGGLAVLAAAAIVLRHRDNLRRLARGEETRP